jgi:hypothetical protein
MLALPSVFTGIATELIAIVGEPPNRGFGGGARVAAQTCRANSRPSGYTQLLLCKLDVDDEDELRFVQTHGAGLFEIGVRVDERCGKRRWSDTPFGRVAWIPV